MTKILLTPNYFLSRIRSKIPYSEDNIFTGGYTIINPELKAEIFDQLKTRLRSAVLTSHPDVASHFIGGFSKFYKWKEKSGSAAVEDVCSLIMKLKQNVHPVFCYVPHNFENNLSHWQSNPQLFTEFIRRAIEEGNVDPALVAKGAAIRVFLYTMGKGFNKFFIDKEGFLQQSKSYDSIKLSSDETMFLPQVSCSVKLSQVSEVIDKVKWPVNNNSTADLILLSSNDSPQYLNTTPYDIPIKFLDNTLGKLKPFFEVKEGKSIGDEIFFHKTKDFHADHIEKVLTKSRIVVEKSGEVKDRYGLELVQVSDNSIDVVPFLVNNTDF